MTRGGRTEMEGVMVREMIKKSLILLVAGASLGTLLLTLAYMLPVSSVKRDASIEILESEGWYPRASVTTSAMYTNFHSFLPDVLDDSTDRIMLYTALDTMEGYPLVRAMNSHSEYMGNYSYYWHGYVSILRPLLLLFDYSELRILNGICQGILVLLLAFIIGKEKGPGHVLMLGTSWLLLNPSALSLSLQYTWVFYIAFGGTLVLLRKRAYFSSGLCYVYFFIAMGMLTSYFDLLTYPLLTWGIPLLWWTVLGGHREEQSVAGDHSCHKAALVYLARVVFSGAAWIMGYALMWVMKWGLATLILGRNIFEDAVYEVFFRLGTQGEEIFKLWDRLNAIYFNWNHYAYKPYAMALMAWLFVWFFRSLWRGMRKSPRVYAYFLTGLSSIVWYFVLANHTHGHHFFTYRIMGVSVLAFMAVVLETTPAAGNRGRDKKLLCCIWLGAALLSIPCVLMAREQHFVLNGYEEFRTTPIPDQAVVEIPFAPAFREITDLNLGLECNGNRGEYEVILWDGDEPLYEHSLPVSEAEGYYRHLEVSWKLDRHKTYRITIRAIDNDAPVSLWVTEGGVGPLEEFKSLWVDGSALEGQLLGGIQYRRLPVSKWMLSFLFLTWTGIWAAVLYVILSVHSLKKQELLS